MLLGPVFQSELVTTARRARYFVLRVLFAAGLLLCLWSCYEGVTYGRLGDGRLSISDASSLTAAFFQTFAWLTLIAAMVVTPAVAAGAIASERERRTIEYLFATDLSNAEIVLSKLAGKLLLLGKLMAVALPVLAIFRLLGGIPGNLLIVYFAGLASTIALLTMGSMCISVWTARARDAVIRVYLVEAVVFVVPIIMWFPLMAVGGVGGRWSWLTDGLGKLVDLCVSINPIFVLGQALSGVGGLGVGLDAGAIWRMVAVHSLLTVGLAILAVTAVRRVHLRSVSSPGGAKKRRWEFPRYRPALGNQPMLWKELFARSAATKLGILGRAALAVVLLAAMGIAMVCYYTILTNSVQNQWMPLGEQFLQASITITVVLSVGTVILAGLRAAGLVTYEKERDCWLSLVSTPLTGGEILGAKVAGNLYAFRWMLLPLLLIWFLQITLSPEYILAIPMHLLAIIATVLFATAVGLAYSLKFDSSLKSIGATMGTLFFVGGGYMLCCCVPAMVAGADDDEVMQIAMAGFVPFLHVAPGLLLIVDDLASDQPWMLFDYVVGTLGYGVAAMVLFSTLVARFEAIVGRTFRGEFTVGTPDLAPANIPAIEPPGPSTHQASHGETVPDRTNPDQST